MKKGINQWAFPAAMALDELFRLARDAGFDGVELNVQASSPPQITQPSGQQVGPLTLDSHQSDAQRIAALASRHGLELPSLSTDLFWKHSLTSNEPEERDAAENIVRRMIDLAVWLGAGAVLVVPGAVDVPWDPGFRPLPYDAVYDRSLSALEELKVYAEEKRVTIAVENVWNKFLLSPLEMRDFIDRLGSQFIGAYFDVGNVFLTGYPEHWIEILGSRIKRVHVKDFRKVLSGLGFFTGLLQGDVNWVNVIDSLRKVGYEGYLTAELFAYKFHSERLIYETAAALDAVIRS